VNAAEYMILVVNRAAEPARNLKELIEFMDTPRVRATVPECWREALGDYRLQALFLGPDLDDDEVEGLIAEVGELDPNASIVMLNEGATP
jgi:hypothetical protein